MQFSSQRNNSQHDTTSYPSLMDLIPLLWSVPTFEDNTAHLSRDVIKQRNFVGYKREEVNDFRTKHLEIVNRTIKFINQRVKQRLQDGVRTRTTIQLGHLEVNEYFCIFHEGHCGKIHTGTRKRKKNGEWSRTKIITHTFNLDRDDCEFDMNNEYTTHGLFPHSGLQVTHVHKFWVKTFKFIYFPEILYGEISILIARDVERIIREFEPLIE
jgi:hypothetical protein